MIHEVKGEFVISSRGVWLPGVYKTKEAARYAFQFDDSVLIELQKSAGTGSITLEMLKAARCKDGA